MQLITITICAEKLQQLIGDAVKKEFEKHKPALARVRQAILTRKETARILKCDLSTLWRKRFKLKPRKKDGTVYYLEHEVYDYIELNEQP